MCAASVRQVSLFSRYSPLRTRLLSASCPPPLRPRCRCAAATAAATAAAATAAADAAAAAAAAADFRKRKQECWSVFRKVWTSWTDWALETQTAEKHDGESRWTAHGADTMVVLVFFTGAGESSAAAGGVGSWRQFYHYDCCQSCPACQRAGTAKQDQQDKCELRQRDSTGRGHFTALIL